MWEEIKKAVKACFENYPMRKVGFFAGVILGVLILIFGVFNTLFAFFCGIVGLYIGSRFEENDELLGKTLQAIEESIPERFRHWKFFS